MKIAVSIALLVAILWYADAIDDVAALFRGAAWDLLAAAFVVMTLDRLLMSYKWILLLKARGLELSLYRGFTIYCAAMMWGTFLPATLGADALRGYLTSRAGLDGYEVAASIIVERMIGFVAALVFGLIGMSIMSAAGAVDERFDPVWWLGGAAIACATCAVLVSFSERVFHGAWRLLPRRAKDSRIAARFRDFHEVYRGYGAERAALATFFLLTLLEQTLAIVATWLLALALGVEVAPWFLAAAVPLSMLIARLPIAFDGIGVYEGIFVLLMGLGGIAPVEALSVALAGRVVQILAWAPWWLLYSVGAEGLSAGRLRHAVAGRYAQWSVGRSADSGGREGPPRTL